MQSSVRPKLPKASRLLLLLGTLFVAAYTLSGMFVNVFIWRVDHSFVAIGLFNVCMYAALPLAFMLAGYLSPKLGMPWMIRAGVITLSVFFGILLWLGSRSGHHVTWLGILFGAGQGFYWYGFHVLTFDLTTDKTRGLFGAWSGLYGTLAATIGPFLAGFLIADNTRFSGYHIVFAVSLGLFATLFALSFRLTVSARHAPLRLRTGFRLRADPDWRRLLIGQVVFGIREGVFAFLIGLLVFFVTHSEAGLGEYGLWTGLLSLAAFWLAGKVSNHVRLSRRLMMVASVLLALGVQVFWWEVSRRTLLVFGLVTAVSLPFLLVPLGAMQLNEIDESSTSRDRRSEHLVAREIALGCGRLVSVGTFTLVALWSPTEHSLIALAAVLGCAHVVVVFIVRAVRYEPREPSTDDELGTALPSGIHVTFAEKPGAGRRNASKT